MLTISKPGALDCYTFFCPILLSLFVSRNPITTHLPLYGTIDSPLCDLIAPTFSLAFSTDATHASGGVVFVRQDLSFSELSTSSFFPWLYSDYVGVNISLNNSSTLSFLNAYAPPICSSPKEGRTDSFSPSILPTSRNLFILGDFNCHHPLGDSRGTSDPRG